MGGVSLFMFGESEAPAGVGTGKEECIRDIRDTRFLFFVNQYLAR